MDRGGHIEKRVTLSRDCQGGAHAIGSLEGYKPRLRAKMRLGMEYCMLEQLCSTQTLYPDLFGGFALLHLSAQEHLLHCGKKLTDCMSLTMRGGDKIP